MQLRIIQAPARRRAFTLGEMLVVLTVFMLLAVIFIFSSQEALTRTRYSRVLQDQSYLIQSLNEYEATRDRLPSQEDGLHALRRDRGRSHTAIPTDAFAENAQHAQDYAFVRDLSPRHQALVISVGPDGDSDVLDALAAFQSGRGLASEPSLVVQMTPEAAQEFIIRYSYDPTNGSTSSGDVISVYLK